jgi:hypothetical protein
MKIYLDDIRTPLDSSWEVVRSCDEFKKLIQGIKLEDVELISLDHDLGETAMQEYFRNTVKSSIINYDNIQECTGYDAVKWLVEYIEETGQEPPIVYSHSANPVGSHNICGRYNNYLKYKRKIQTSIRHNPPHTT